LVSQLIEGLSDNDKPAFDGVLQLGVVGMRLTSMDAPRVY